MATLTGGQSVTTGHHHASILSNQGAWENICVENGKLSGDLCYPILYCPEFQADEFASHVADMKNSNRDRSNCPTSCGGIFIQSHLKDGFDFKGTTKFSMKQKLNLFRHCYSRRFGVMCLSK